MLRLATSALLCSALALTGCSAKQSTAPHSAAEVDATHRGVRSLESVEHPRLLVLQVLADNPMRSEANRARNAARHPAETLDFFGIETDMTVIEIGPSGGWYAEIIAPFVIDAGRYIGALDDPEGPRAHYRAGWEKLVQTHPEIFETAETTIFNPPAHHLADENSVDLILTFRHVHGWINAGTAEASFQEFFRALKPGGVLGLVQHRALPGTDASVTAKHGYVPEAWVIAAAEAAGFELEARSEINANPKDDTNHPEGVWSLVPTLKGSEADQARYREIGESDRMTLKFRKPVAAQ